VSREKQRVYEFGPFRLDPGQQQLFKDGIPVPLTPKAFDTLLALVQKHGQLVSKEELLQTVWPDAFVEESTLAQNVFRLRKLLADGEAGSSWIETIPKRGYRFTAPVRESQPETLAPVSVHLPEQAAKTDAGTAAQRAKSPRRWRFPATVAAAALLSLGSAVYWLGASRPALSFANREWILVADFENRTGDARFDKALLTALSVSLEQSRHANVFPRSRVYETLQRMGRQINTSEELTVSEALGREMCQRENLRALVAASLTRTGTQFLLVGRLVDPKSGSSIRSYTVRIQSEDQILDALDTVAKNIRQDLGETLYSIQRDSLPLPHVTTSSLSALELYAQANDLWRRGKYQDSRTQLQEALRIDPDFAMAHAALGNELYSHIFSQPTQGKQEYERALRLSGRVTAREHMYIEASFAGAQAQTDGAVRLYRALLGSYPDDTRALFGLATVLLRANRCNDAIAEYRELIRINPSDVNSQINIATCYANQSKYAEALSYYGKAFELDPERLTSAAINREYGFTLVGAGHPEKAREVFTLALARPEARTNALRSLGLLDLYEGRYRDGIARLKEAIRANQTDKNDLGVARNRMFLATAYQGQGDVTSELSELDEVANIDALFTQAPWLAARMGMAYARAGAPERAVKVLDAVRARMNSGSPTTQSDAGLLEGEILVARGKFAQAIELLQNARQENYPPSVVLSLEGQARAYEKSGQSEKAIACYEAFLGGQGVTPLAWEAQQQWLEAHYELAKLEAARGDTTRETQLLDTLLGIWKNADSDLPLLQQAKALRNGVNR
jgi:DNA-binding winged helix-turn-helix (wHTH) protein/tetratricopeptide (TPR) repeat protein